MTKCETNVIGCRALINIHYETIQDAIAMEKEIIRYIRDIVLFDVNGTMLRLIQYTILQKGKTIYLEMLWHDPEFAKMFVRVWNEEWKKHNQ